MPKYYISQDNEMIPTDLNTAVAAARALGHSARLRAVAMLRSGELCVCQITEVLKLASSTVSLHLKELKRSGWYCQVESQRVETVTRSSVQVVTVYPDLVRASACYPLT